jgi:hypothetical protein
MMLCDCRLSRVLYIAVCKVVVEKFICNSPSSIVVASPILLAATGVSIAQTGYDQTMIKIHQEMNTIPRLFRPLRYPHHLIVRFRPKPSGSSIQFQMFSKDSTEQLS